MQQSGRKRHPLWRVDTTPATTADASLRPGQRVGALSSKQQPSSAQTPSSGVLQRLHGQQARDGSSTAIRSAQNQARQMHVPEYANPLTAAGVAATSSSPSSMPATTPWQQVQQPAKQSDPRVRRFMGRVRLALLDSCQAAVLVNQQLVQERQVSSKHTPKFPLEKLQEAYMDRFNVQLDPRVVRCPSLPQLLIQHFSKYVRLQDPLRDSQGFEHHMVEPLSRFCDLSTIQDATSDTLELLQALDAQCELARQQQQQQMMAMQQQQQQARMMQAAPVQQPAAGVGGITHAAMTQAKDIPGVASRLGFQPSPQQQQLSAMADELLRQLTEESDVEILDGLCDDKLDMPAGQAADPLAPQQDHATNGPAAGLSGSRSHSLDASTAMGTKRKQQMQQQGAKKQAKAAATKGSSEQDPPEEFFEPPGGVEGQPNMQVPVNSMVKTAAAKIKSLIACRTANNEPPYYLDQVYADIEQHTSTRLDPKVLGYATLTDLVTKGIPIPVQLVPSKNGKRLRIVRAAGSSSQSWLPPHAAEWSWIHGKKAPAPQERQQQQQQQQQPPKLPGIFDPARASSIPGLTMKGSSHIVIPGLGSTPQGSSTRGSGVEGSLSCGQGLVGPGAGSAGPAPVAGVAKNDVGALPFAIVEDRSKVDLSGKPSDTAAAAAAPPEPGQGSSSCKVHVSSLAADVTKLDLLNALASCGGITQVVVRQNIHGGRYALVEFSTPSEAQAAIKFKNHMPIKGRRAIIKPCTAAMQPGSPTGVSPVKHETPGDSMAGPVSSAPPAVDKEGSTALAPSGLTAEAAADCPDQATDPTTAPELLQTEAATAAVESSLQSPFAYQQQQQQQVQPLPAAPQLTQHQQQQQQQLGVPQAYVDVGAQAAQVLVPLGPVDTSMSQVVVLCPPAQDQPVIPPHTGLPQGPILLSAPPVLHAMPAAVPVPVAATAAVPARRPMMRRGYQPPPPRDRGLLPDALHVQQQQPQQQLVVVSGPPSLTGQLVVSGPPAAASQVVQVLDGQNLVGVPAAGGAVASPLSGAVATPPSSGTGFETHLENLGAAVAVATAATCAALDAAAAQQQGSHLQQQQQQVCASPAEGPATASYDPVEDVSMRSPVVVPAAHTQHEEQQQQQQQQTHPVEQQQQQQQQHPAQQQLAGEPSHPEVPAQPSSKTLSLAARLAAAAWRNLAAEHGNDPSWYSHQQEPPPPHQQQQQQIVTGASSSDQTYQQQDQQQQHHHQGVSLDHMATSYQVQQGQDTALWGGEARQQQQQQEVPAVSQPWQGYAHTWDPAATQQQQEQHVQYPGALSIGYAAYNTSQPQQLQQPAAMFQPALIGVAASAPMYGSGYLQQHPQGAPPLQPPLPAEAPPDDDGTGAVVAVGDGVAAAAVSGLAGGSNDELQRSWEQQQEQLQREAWMESCVMPAAGGGQFGMNGNQYANHYQQQSGMAAAPLQQQQQQQTYHQQSMLTAAQQPVHHGVQQVGSYSFVPATGLAAPTADTWYQHQQLQQQTEWYQQGYGTMSNQQQAPQHGHAQGAESYQQQHYHMYPSQPQ